MKKIFVALLTSVLLATPVSALSESQKDFYKYTQFFSGDDNRIFRD